MSAKILKLVIHYFSKDCDSGLAVYTIKSKTAPTEEQLSTLGVHSHYCNHSYDCCGCWQRDRPFVECRNKRNEWKVTERCYRNV